MLGLNILDVAIGLTFVYVLLSILCSALVEALEQKLQMRRSLLKDGIKALLDDPVFTFDFLRHPLIKSLDKDAGHCEEASPSYIPSGIFAAAALDIALGNTSESTAPKTIDMSDPAAIRAALALGYGSPVNRALLAFYDQAMGDLETTKKNVEQWFDDSMERLSGHYKRYAVKVNAFIAIFVVAISNADSIVLAKVLWQDDSLREQVVDAAVKYTDSENAAKSVAATQSADDRIRDLTKSLDALGLPIGWSSADTSRLSIGGWVNKIIGLLVTMLAVSLGAPFWVELLNKLVSLRNTGKAPLTLMEKDAKAAKSAATEG